MAHAYSQDLRVRALDLIESGMPISRVSRILKISRPTLYRWIEQFEMNGSTAPCKSLPPPQVSKIKDWEKFKEVVDNNGDKTQRKIAEIWGNISQQAILLGIKKAGIYPQKKTYSYQERCEESRSLFREKLGQYQPEDLIYMDESGIDSNETYPYGWSKKGQRFHSSRPGKRQDRLSIVGALCKDKLLAPMVYQGYCTAKVIEGWLRHFLWPKLRPGQVIIMDNAPFHNSHKIKELIEEAGCELLFLPSYSPDLNPIEHWWHKIKTAIRKELPLYEFNLHQAADAAFHYL